MTTPPSPFPYVLAPISVDYATAGLLTGFSQDVIRKAADAGEIERHYPEIGLRTLSKPVVMVDDLRAWVMRGPADR